MIDRMWLHEFLRTDSIMPGIYSADKNSHPSTQLHVLFPCINCRRGIFPSHTLAACECLSSPLARTTMNISETLLPYHRFLLFLQFFFESLWDWSLLPFLWNLLSSLLLAFPSFKKGSTQGVQSFFQK